MNFFYHESLEFIYSMFALAQEDLNIKLLKSKPLSGSNDRFDGLFKKLKKDISKPLLYDLQKFYSLNGIGYALYNLIFKHQFLNPTTPLSLNQFIDAIYNITYEEYLTYLAASNFNVELSTLNYENIRDQFLVFLEDTVLPEPQRQSELLRIYEAPELLNELIEATTAYYEECYSHHKSEIDCVCLEILAEYETLYDDNPQSFANRFIGGSQTLTEGDFIHVSLFGQLSLNLYQSKWENRTAYALGYRSCDLIIPLNDLDKIAYFHKVLSDPKRLELIGYIAKRPYYGQELANVLNIATSTTSYHLNMLMDLNLVTTTREQKKVYFYFNFEAYNQLNKRLEATFI